MTKVILTAVGFLALAIVVFVYLAIYHPGRREASQRVEAVVSRGHDGQAAQLAAQVEELQRSLNALKSQVPRHEDGAAHAVPTSDTKPAELSVEEQRAQDRERLRTYMAGVAQAFANEKVDAAWASNASSRVTTTFEGDEVLKGVARTVECRSQTCRVQIEDDGTGQLSRRMPFLAIGLADLLPSISAEHIEQGNGRTAMVLYMSSQRTAPSATGK